jgi:hypothetical protein
MIFYILSISISPSQRYLGRLSIQAMLEKWNKATLHVFVHLSSHDTSFHVVVTGMNRLDEYERHHLGPRVPKKYTSWIVPNLSGHL